jgi:hypothetical protein
MNNLPKQISPGTPALLYDPASARNRNGNDWCPVTLTGEESQWLSGTCCVQIVTPSGMTRWFSASEIQFKRESRWRYADAVRGTSL